MSPDLVKDSIRLSKILRHRPDIKHDDNGWFDVDLVLEHMGCDLQHLKEVVASNTRFGFSEDGRMIRAYHGHSIKVAMDEVFEPSGNLYHGTSVDLLDKIRESGAILRMKRRYVHLTLDYETAVLKGSRHGDPVVLVIDAKRMHDEGFVFYESMDGVVLTERVPMEYVVNIVYCKETD